MFSLFPHQCKICHLSVDRTRSPFLWCDACFTLLLEQSRHHHFQCQRCGLPTSEETDLCGRCIRELPPWDRLFCIGDYQSPLREVIHQFKYQQQFWLATPLAHLLIEFINHPADVCISVPLHWQRQLKRSFNQSDLLSQALIKQWRKQGHNVELIHALKRIQSTPHQKGLDKKQRQKNLKQAFTLIRPIPYKHIALIDDVVTTGSTLAPICKLLKSSGVERIDVYCLCRTALL